MKVKNIVILGAGISGLALAWFLQKRFGNTVDITLLEASYRTGGWIQTTQKEGFLFEAGPHSCRLNSSHSATYELIHDLGLTNQLIEADASANVRYLFMNNTLAAVPRKFFSWLMSPLLKGIPQAILRDLFTQRSELPDESIYDFFTRRFGKQIAERFADPLTTGIYAGDIRRLSIRSCFPLLHQSEQQYGSVLKSLWKRPRHTPSRIFSFKNGMGSLIHALEKKANVVSHCSVQRIQLDSEIGVWGSNGFYYPADHLFSTLPAWALAPLIEPHNIALAKELSEIEYASLSVIHLGFHAPVLKKKGFGYLVPRNEKEEILGMIWDSCVFPQQNQKNGETRLTVMLGGTSRSEQECISIAIEALASHLGITQKPDATNVVKVEKAIPQYTLGYAQKLEKMASLKQQLSPRMSFLGSAFSGVAVTDCIAEAKHQASSYDFGLFFQ